MKYYYQVEGYLRNNIGDVLQGMVAKAFLPKEATVVDREALADVDSSDEALLLANGWYMHTFEKFPPPENISPIYVSVHIAHSQILKEAKTRIHFKKHAPIGCRDKKTEMLFLGWGIPAYYSGCLTITALKRAEINNTGKGEVLLVDNIDHPVPDFVKSKLETLLKTSFISVSHNPPDLHGTIEEYDERSEAYMNSLLERYCKAALVITTKIHCALPCLGMGANVMMIHPNPFDPRLATVREFIEVLSYKDVMAAKELIKPLVDLKALNQRKEFLSRIVTESVAIGKNIMSFPDNDELKKIRRKSIWRAIFYRFGIKSILTLGLANDQMKRVYGYAS